MGLGPRGLLAWGLQTGAQMQMVPPHHQETLEPETVSLSVGTDGLVKNRLIHASIEEHTESMEVSIENDGAVHGARMEPDKQKPKARENAEAGSVDDAGGLLPQGVEIQPHAPVGRAERDVHDEAPAARKEALVDVSLAKQWKQAGQHRHDMQLQAAHHAEAAAAATIAEAQVHAAATQLLSKTLTKVTLAVAVGGGVLGFGVFIDYVCFATCLCGILYYLFTKYCDSDKSTYVFNCRCWRRLREKVGADHFKTFTLAVAVHKLEDMRDPSCKYLLVPLSRPVGKGKKKPSSELLKKAQKTSEGLVWSHETVQVVCEQGKEDLQLAVYKAKALGREEYVGSVELSIMDDVLGPMGGDTWSVSTRKAYTVLDPKGKNVGKLSVSFYRPPPAPGGENPETHDEHPVVKAGFRHNLSIPFLRAVEDAIEHLVHANLDTKHQVPVNKLHVLSTLLSGDFNLDIGGSDDFRAFEVLRKKKSKKWFWVWYKSTTSRDVAGQIPIAAITNISAVPSNREAIAIAYQGKGHVREELYLGVNPQSFVKGREEVVQAVRMLLSAVAEDEGREGPQEDEGPQQGQVDD